MDDTPDYAEWARNFAPIMAKHKVMLFFSTVSDPFSEDLGNLLADFVDAGKVLLIAPFAFRTAGELIR